MKDYWDSIADHRIDRRRLLRLSAATGAGALALSLADCGGSSNGSHSGSGASGLATKKEDSTSRAKRGGTYVEPITADIPSFDPIAAYPTPGPALYSRFVKLHAYNTSKGEELSDALDADAAESWEISPDGLTVTLKMRQGMKFDQRAPTNGREMDIDDVKFTWDRFSSVGRTRATYLNSLSPVAPVTGVTFLDSKTVTFKLAFPTVSFLPSMGYWLTIVALMPKESADKFDPRKDVRGSGPWQLKSFAPSASASFVRNPDWYDKDKIYLDGFDTPIIIDASQRLAQFAAGRTWEPGAITLDDIVPTKKDHPELQLVQNDRYRGTDDLMIFDLKQGSPYLDERVRQAVSMSIDRELMVRTFGGIDKFAKEGLDVPYRWNSHFQSSYPFWVDPKGNDLGDGAKYFHYDQSEAVKLMQAAGYSKDKPLEAGYNPPSPFFNQDLMNITSALAEQLNSSGVFKIETKVIDYQTDYLQNYNTNGVKKASGYYHNFQGISPQLVADWPDVDMYISAFMRPGGSFYKWEDGTPSNFPNDAQLTAMFDAQRGERDNNKRTSILKDIQKRMAQKMYHVPAGAWGFKGYSLAQPWVGNFNVYSTYDTAGVAYSGPVYGVWYDESKKKA